MDDGHEETNLI